MASNEVVFDFSEEFFTELSQIIEESRPHLVEEEIPIYNSLYDNLESNPYYFFSWRKEAGVKPLVKWDRQEFLAYLSEVFMYFAKPKSRKQIEEMEECSEMSQRQQVVLFFIVAYLNIGVRFIRKGTTRWAASTRCIRGAVQFTEKSVTLGLHPEYLEGVQYLYRWALLHIYLRKEKLPPPMMRNFHGENKFAALPDKGKAIVLGAKSIFLSGFQKNNQLAKEMSIDAMRQIVKLDPLAYEWHYQLGNWLRCERRRLNTTTIPSEEEIQTFWETYAVCEYTKVDEDDPLKDSTLKNMALAGVCQVMAEVIRFRFYDRTRSLPVTIGGLVFQSDQEMANFVLKNVHKMMSNERHTFAELIRSGDILANILPFQLKDYISAEKYFMKAFSLMPFNSKINHKLGVLYVVSEGLFNMEKSLKHLRLAVIQEEANFPAAMDLLNTLLHAPAENAKEIQDLVRILGEKSWKSAKDEQQLRLAHGVLNFMLGDEVKAVEEWICAYKCSPTDELFSRVGSTSKRHKWNRNLFNFGKMSDALKNFPVTSVEDAEIVTKLLENVPPSKPRAVSESNQNYRPYPHHTFISDADNHWRRPTIGTTPTVVAAPPTAINTGKYIPPYRRRLNSEGSWRS